jgi:hypothetical protein
MEDQCLPDSIQKIHQNINQAIMMVAFFRLNCLSNVPNHLRIFDFFGQLAFIHIDHRPTKNQPLSITPTSG